MNKLSWSLVAVLLAAGLQTMAARQVTAQGEKLLAAAEHKATVDGDLKGAIEEYRKIVAGAGADRALAAQALVQMAECYQKLGDAESRKIYERVVKEYADQPDAVSIASARLGRIKAAAGETGIVTRQVWTGPNVASGPGVVSADGRFIVYQDWNNDSLALHDLAVGTDRVLTKDVWPDGLAISPDGRQVAYGPATKGRLALHELASDAGASATPRVLRLEDGITSIAPSAWSPDGRWIAVQFTRTDGTYRLGLVNASDGTLRTLRATDQRGSTRMAFSPDGKYLAFDLLSGEKAEARDVFVLAVDGSGEIRAVVHPANDAVIGWMPDGLHLLFASDRSGAQALWALPWSEGKPRGEPGLLKTDVDLGWPLGVTRTGALYYGVSLSWRDVYVAAIDTSTGAVLSPPVRPIEQPVGANSGPDWSPDGKFLAYVTRRTVLGIRSMDTGQTRELRPPLSFIYSPRWAPDGRSLMVMGDDEKGQRGIYRIDAQTGTTRTILQVPPGDSLYGLDWFPEGKRLVFRCNQPGSSVVVEYDIDSGTRRVLLPGGASTLSLSPDGRQLAYVTRTPSWQMMVMPMAGGQPRQVRVEGVEWSMVVGWTPDNRSILIQASTSAGGDLWLVSADGGPARKVALNLRNLIPSARFNPRTNQLAVTAATGKNEVWVMENLLPAAKAPAPRRQEQ